MMKSMEKEEKYLMSRMKSMKRWIKEKEWRRKEKERKEKEKREREREKEREKRTFTDSPLIFNILTVINFPCTF